MFDVMLYGRFRISSAINGLSLSKSRPYLGFLTFATSSSATSANDELQKDQSFTVSYLVNSCGLSPEAAIVASKKVCLPNPKTPDSVLSFLREHELSDAQISNLVLRYPYYLVADPTKSFLPKLKFLYSKGISKETMANVLASNAYLLKRSLRSCIVPIFDLLKSISASDEQVIAALNQWRLSFEKNRENIASNIELLNRLGIGNSRIVSVLLNFPCVMILKPEKLNEVVKKVTDMGFDPHKSVFVLALRTFSMTCYEKRWRENFKVYEKWGWSESDILEAYKYHPYCMTYSEEKIDKSMDYLVNVMGHDAKEIARVPVILCYSLEKRIRPRCSVIRVLLKKGLVDRGNLKLYGVVQIIEKIFLAKYVTMYEKQVPLLMSVYQGKVGIDEA